MDKELLMGIDIGTQGTKILVVDTNGHTVAVGSYSYDFYVPKAGWAEQDPLQWWHAVQKSLKQIWDKGIKPDQIRGIGVSGQMHSLVLLDENKEELGNAILWNDVRTHKECTEIEQIVGKSSVLGITRNAVLPGFTAPKLLWVRKHEPERFARIRHVMLPKDYIVFKLSGVFSCDVSDASGTALLDTKKRMWSREMVEALGIPLAWLPEVHESQTIVGNVSQHAATVTELAVGTEIVAGAGDNAAAALGNGIYEEGSGIVSVGTSGTVFAPLKQLPIVHDDEQLATLHQFCHCLPDTWHAMGVTLSAGMSLNWFKHTFSEESYDAFLAGIDDIPAGAGGLYYLPYLNGERTPHNDPDARGVFFGIHYQHTRDHFTRAVLEGVSYSLRDCYELIKRCNVSINDLYVTGGASKSPAWRQILTDVLGRGLTFFDGREGPAFGASLLAGLGTGVWENAKAFPAFFDTGNETAMIHENAKQYDTGYHMYKKIYDHVKPLFHS
ncbi:xylulokinase [Lentibacillus daqui]|uniref:xylulokinase n=1 Tax=Lentibacillus daqui TaxID=2911514 RepID=UPI0022B15793|nr:xylulokinase [Lentibacillus daqui]